MKITIVVPLYNEQKYITEVLRSLLKYRLPIVVVDDGSTDNSKIKVFGLKSKSITVLEHGVNLGKGAAMKTGADFAFSNGADAIIFMDSDGQHKASDLPKFIEALESGKYDVVFGSRNYSYGVPLIRFLGNKFAAIVMRMSFGSYISDVLCGFRGITKNAYRKIRWDSMGYGVEIEMIARLKNSGLTLYELPVETVYRDKVKGVTILDAIEILGNVLKWKVTLK